MPAVTEGRVPPSHRFPDGWLLTYYVRASDNRVMGQLFNEKGTPIGRAFLYKPNALPDNASSEA